MEIQVNINGNIESNLFLRNLWSILGEDTHRAWQLLPRKDAKNNRTYFGVFSCSLLSKTYMISIKYKTKGSINSIIFEPPWESDVVESDKELIKKSVESALMFNENIKRHWCSIRFKTIGLSLNNYSEEMFEIESFKRITEFSQDMRLSIYVNGFDTIDVKAIAQKKQIVIIDFLSTIVESALFHGKMDSDESETAEVNNYCNSNWMEEPPLVHGKLLMSSKAKEFLNSYINEEISEEMNIYLSASRLYHTALKYYSFIYFGERIGNSSFIQYDASPHEIANTLFMSSLEVLSKIIGGEEAICNECGQKRYSIRRQVIDLCEKYSDGYLPKTVIDTYYNDRSSYVHAGLTYSDMSYTGSSIPTLSQTGDVIAQIPHVDLITLKESIGFIFRAVLEEI